MVKDNRVNVTFRVAPHQRDWLDQAASEHGVDRTVVIRAALAVAKARSDDLDRIVIQMRDMG